MIMNNKIQDLHLNGISSDTFLAEYNYLIFIKIKKVWENVLQLENEEKQLFVYLKECSKNNTIIYLSRLYDNPNRNYETRCIEEVIIELQKNPDLLRRHTLTSHQWEKFKNKHKSCIFLLEEYGEVNVETYIECISLFLSSQKEKKKNTLINDLKDWRDKRLVHNENVVIDVLFEDDQIKQLIDLPKSLIDYLNHFVSTESHVVYSMFGQVYFIDALIKRTFDEVK